MNFEYGSHFGGDCEFLIIDKGNGICQVYAEGYNDFDLYWNFEVPKSRLKRLEAAVRPARKWLSSYELDDVEVDDGYGWELVFMGQEYEIRTSGYMSNPSDYFRVGKRILKQLKKIKESSGNGKCEPLLPINGYKYASIYKIFIKNTDKSYRINGRRNNDT